MDFLRGFFIVRKAVLFFLSFVLFFSAAAPRLRAQADPDWREKVQQELPLMGHRNWIMIVDSAYPLQVSPGVETIETGMDQLAVTRFVLGALDHSIHVTPNVYLDAELSHLNDELAPGIRVYREHLNDLIKDRPVKSLPHEALIKQINDAGQTFHVLVLKTTMTLPYTSVFLQLDCRYWPPQNEQMLRQMMRDGR
ncbi:MAG TPA: hypothetical protein VHB45_09150 [Alloacidobacterium sp.]|nr:hypothetical protein [Alloacidobacterium sp.]